MKGIIFNIQKFSLHDGPGIRTTVFLKGCPLRCKWCANPESQLMQTQILCDKDHCIKCQSCLRQCPSQAIYFEDNQIKFDYSKCIGCLQCISVCPNKALSHEGNQKTVEEIVEICKQDYDFYLESNGGITISGGEGMSQPEFLKALVLELKKEKLHVAIETTGYIEPAIFRELAPLFDLLLMDIKHVNINKHIEGTGVDPTLIHQNLKWALQQNIEILPRIPVIPNFNNQLEDAHEISDFLVENNIKKVQLLPFHQFGERKYELLGLEYSYKSVKQLYKEDLIEYQNIFTKKGLEAFF